MNDSTTHLRKSRGRLMTGVVLLIVGGILLAINLGFEMPHGWYGYWPWLLVTLGAAQLAWPGTLRERLGGYWLVVIGAYGLIGTYQLLGLEWSTAWPIFVIAGGVRIVIGSLIGRADKDAPKPSVL